jgi:ankyrin repeat protein
LLKLEQQRSEVHLDFRNLFLSHQPRIAQQTEMPFSYSDSDDDASLPMIFRATERGDFDTVKRLIEEDASVVHETIDTDDQPLHIACWQKYESIVKLLINAGANVNAGGDFGQTPLHYAVFEGDEYSTAIVRLLLDAGADPKITDKRSQSTPLKWAQREHHDGLEPTIKMLKSKMG